MSGAEPDPFYMLTEVDLTECHHRWQAFALCTHIAKLSPAPADKKAFAQASRAMLETYFLPVEHEMAQRLLKSREYRKSLKGSDRWDRSRAFVK